jgi:hypothetical protein
MLTEEDIRKRMLALMEESKQEIRQARPSRNIGSPVINPVAHFIWPHREERVAWTWETDDDKLTRGLAISVACEISGVSCLLIRVITTMLARARIEKEMGITAADLSWDEFQERMYAWLKTKTGGDKISGLPRDYTTDAITIAAMGPGIKSNILHLTFEWSHGSWLFGQDPLFLEGIINVIPKWWD